MPAPGAQPGAASSNPAKSKPGTTTQLTSAQPADALAACHAPAAKLVGPSWADIAVKQDAIHKGMVEAFKVPERDRYQIVTEPAADVLRVETAVVDIDVEAPDTMSAGMTRVYTHEAGGAVLVVEARDSVTGAVLGRAVDGDTTGDLGPYLRNRATNTGEFEQLFSHWAKVSVDGLAELKQLSPVDAQGRLAKR